MNAATDLQQGCFGLIWPGSIGCAAGMAAVHQPWLRGCSSTCTPWCWVYMHSSGGTCTVVVVDNLCVCKCVLPRLTGFKLSYGSLLRAMMLQCLVGIQQLCRPCCTVLHSDQGCVSCRLTPCGRVPKHGAPTGGDKDVWAWCRGCWQAVQVVGGQQVRDSHVSAWYILATTLECKQAAGATADWRGAWRNQWYHRCTLVRQLEAGPTVSNNNVHQMYTIPACKQASISCVSNLLIRFSGFATVCRGIAVSITMASCLFPVLSETGPVIDHLAQDTPMTGTLCWRLIQTSVAIPVGPICAVMCANIHTEPGSLFAANACQRSTRDCLLVGKTSL